MKKFGFTLSEVLITLGIIGVIAAVTTPIVVKTGKYESSAAKLAVTVSNIENAFTNAIATEGATDLFHTHMWDNVPVYESGKGGGLNSNSTDDQIAAFMGELGRYLVTNGYRHETSDVFYARNSAKTYKMLSNGSKGGEIVMGNEGTGNMFPILMKNGAVVFFRAMGEGTYHADEDAVKAAGGSLYDNPGDVFIDVNGSAPPNIIGRDIFNFYLGQNGILYPAGGRDVYVFETINDGKEVSSENTNTWDNPKSFWSCVSGQINIGWGCTARLIEENYKMNY